MKTIMIIASLLIWHIKSCQNELFIENSSFQVFEGVIYEDDRSSKIFLQDHQDGDFIELKFFYDDPKWIDFDEFNIVEVKGHYNQNKNAILVEELYPLPHNKINIKSKNNTLASVD